MPETRRRYTWSRRFDDPLIPVAVIDTVDTVLARWLANARWLDSAEASAGEDGSLTVTAVVRGRDQWRVRERALKLSRALAAALRVRRDMLGTPVAAKLPPHTHRGAAAVAWRLEQQARQQEHGYREGGDGLSDDGFAVAEAPDASEGHRPGGRNDRAGDDPRRHLEAVT